MTTFAERFAAAIDHLGLSRDEIAERLGCSVGYVSQLATGKRVPTLHKIYAIAIALDCDPNNLDPRLASELAAPRRVSPR